MSAKAAPNYRRIYPSQEEAVVFDGGLDNKYERSLLPDNESPDCANVVFYNGSVGSRDGAVKVNTNAVASAPFDGLFTRRANDQSETMIAWANGNMYTLGSTTFITVPSAQSVFTAGSKVTTETAENYMFIGNGGSNPYKWNGTNFTVHGVSAPTAAMTIVSSTTGALASGGSYTYGYTWVNSALVEGNISPLTTFVVSNAGKSVSITGISTAPASAGVTARRIYRTIANGATYQLLKIISDNVSITTTDAADDTTLTSTAPTDNGVPPNYSAIIYHRNILFVNDPANPNYVRYSVIGQPYTFPLLNFFKVGDNTSDIVRGFFIHDNQLFIKCDKTIWVNYMPDPGTPSGWRQIPTLSPYGSKSPYCSLSFLNSVLFPAMQGPKFVGFAAMNGLSVDPTSTLLTITSAGSQLTSDRIEPDMFNVQESFIQNITGIVFKTRAYISVTYGAGNTTNNRVYLFDFSFSNIKKQQQVTFCPITGWNASHFTIYGGKLYYASSDSTGFVFQVDGTGVYSDNGVAIDSYFYTKEFTGFVDETNYSKDFRYANILIDNAGSYFMNLTYKTDSDAGTGQAIPISVSNGGTNWGSLMFGTSLWGGGNSQSEQRAFLQNARGKRLQFKFSNQNVAGQRFKVHRMNFAYNVKGFR